MSDENPLKEPFQNSIRHLTKDQLLELIWLADETIGASEMVLHHMRQSPGGDHYIYRGSMNRVEIARDTTADYRAFLVRHFHEPTIDEDL